MPLWQQEIEQAIQAGHVVQESYSRLLDAIEAPELRNVVRDLLFMEEMNEVLLRNLTSSVAMT